MKSLGKTVWIAEKPLKVLDKIIDNSPIDLTYSQAIVILANKKKADKK